MAAVQQAVPPPAISSEKPGSAPSSNSPATRRIQLLSETEVARHSNTKSCWVVRRGKVYDVTEFVEDHPGGDDLILRYAGKDMGEIMDDPIEHSHSDSAYELLEEYLIGRLAVTEEEKALVASKAEGGADFSGKDENVIITDDFVPTDTDSSKDFSKHQFLDLSRPLILQVWNAKFNKEFYLAQVHSPRHLKEPAQLFGPWYLEMFTRTPYYVVPMVWLPISAALFLRSMAQFAGFNPPLSASPALTYAAATSSATALPLTLACFALGVLIWTILEYSMHRFLFHVDEMLPDRPFFLMLHFLLHGIHHYLPMDRLRLVMPPILFLALSYPFTVLAHKLFVASVANGIISGAYAMYVCYDTMHYALHHTKLPNYMREMKKYHLEHHYKNYELGFGVTSKFWDYIFGTQL